MKSMSELARDMMKATEELAKLDKNLPRILGKTAVDITRQNFKSQGFEGATWPQRDDKTNKAYDKRGNYKGSVYNSSSPILVQSGNLRDSIRYVVSGNKVSIGTFDSRIIPYAQAHNEGLGHQKKRQFIGYTLKMDILLRDKIEKEHEKALKKFKK